MEASKLVILWKKFSCLKDAYESKFVLRMCKDEIKKYRRSNQNKIFRSEPVNFYQRDSDTN